MSVTIISIYLAGWVLIFYLQYRSGKMERRLRRAMFRYGYRRGFRAGAIAEYKNIKAAMESKLAEQKNESSDSE